MAKKIITHTFPVDIIREIDGKGYYVVVPTLPGCVSQGKTIEEAKQNIEKAIQLHLSCLKKSGEFISIQETFHTGIEVTL